MIKTANNSTQNTGLRRGDTTPTGGRFVGNANGSSRVSNGGDADFRQMCQDFERTWNSSRRAA